MPTNTGGGTTTSLDNTPQAKDDFYIACEDQVLFFNVMSNDLGGNAKTLWSIDNTSDDGSLDLVSKDVAGVCEFSELGAKISLTPDGKIRYDTSLLDHLPEGQTVTDQFTYAIRLGNGTLSWATVTVTLKGTNDGPVAVADTGSTTENACLTVNVLANDTDADDGHVLTVTAASTPAGQGSASIVGNQVKFDPGTDFDHLAAGATASVVVSYTIKDEYGATSSSTLTITITGTNDDPVAVADTAEVDEDASISGTVATNDSDVDHGALLTYALDDPAPTGLTFGDDGGWSFDASSYDSLAEDEELVLVIPYTVTDEHGASDGASLTITITGTNDDPVAVADTAEVDEDASISGTVATNDSDVDHGALLTYALDDPAPTGLTFGDDGGWSFDASSYDSLAEDEELVLVIPYTVTDEHGASDGASLTITITGTNDDPVAVADTAEVDEDASISGTVATNDSDVDHGALLTYALDDPAPTGLTFGDDGGWSFDASSYDSLAEDEELVLVIPYTVTDEHGASDGASLTITITGTNDDPVAVADTAEVDEDASISGTVATNDSDVDHGALLTYALDDPAPTGLTFGDDGGWSFDASSYDSLAEDEELVLVIPYTVTDEHGASDGASLTITITGTNDDPVAVADTAEVDEDASISGTVATNDSDVDHGALLTYALDDPAPTGLTFGDDGGWSFDASSYDSLAEDEELVLVIPYTVTDEHGASDGASLTITITGTNDDPVAVADTAEVDEDASISGTVATNDSDVDHGALLTYALDDPAPTGLTFGDDGGWSFDASSYDSLAEDEELVLVIPYTVTDEHGASDGASLTITITGTNDDPVAVADTAEVDEDASISGTVATNDSDVDHGALLTYALDDPAPTGLTFGDDGGWSFDASSYDSLAEDEELVLVIPYTVTDEHGASDGASLTITITGTNDDPVAVADTAEVDEDASISGTVATNDSDVDHGALLTYALDDPAPTGLTFGDDGGWSFDASSYDSLAEDEELVLVIPYTVTDEHGASDGASLTITITGTNDDPVAVADTAEVDEDASISGTVATNDSDVDHGALLTYALDDPAPTGLTFGDDGGWSFDASSYDSLAEDEELVLVIPYTVTDEHGASDGASLTITITGTNDDPVAVADTAEVDEDASISGTVATNDSDVDHGALLTYALDDPAPTGLTFGDDGGWSFDASSYDSLAEDEELVLVIPYTVTDEHGASDGASLTITITGTNDDPVAVADTNSATEGGPAVIGSVATNDSDPDDGASLSYALVAPVAGLTLNANGSYSFDPTNAAYNHLAAGATTDVVASYTVSDGLGGSDTTTLTITVTGTNDDPVAVADTNSATEGGPAVIGSVATNDSDPDDGASLSYALVAPVAGLTLNANGSYSFDPTNAAYNHLAAGATTDVVASYTVSDGLGGSDTTTLTITVTGTNDDPVAVADTNSATEGGPAVIGSVATNDSDPDDGASLSYALVAPVAGLTLNANGSYSFDPTNAAYNHLAQGATTDVVASYTVSDGLGGSDTTTLTITVTGTNDAATISVVPGGDYGVIEAGGVANGTPGDPSASGQVTVADVDDGQAVFQAPASLNGTYGTFTFNTSNGQWTYTLNNNLTATQALNVGSAVTDTLTVTSLDGTDSENIVVNITGTNDAAVISGTTSGSVTEAGSSNGGGTPSVSGTLTDTDVDNPANTFTAVASAMTSVNGYGSFTMTAGGTWTYTVNNSNPTVNALNNGGTLNDSFVVTSIDGTQKTISITIDGANDAAVVANIKFVPNGNDYNTTLPGGEVFGSFVAYDAAGNVIPGATFSVTAGSVGTLTVAANGAVSGNLNNNDLFNFSVTSGSVTEAVTVQVGTGTGNSIPGTGNLDIAFGVNGGDTINGSTNDDTLYGNNIADTLNGGDGDDFLIGGNDGDALNGNNGNDFLRGGVGNDILNGGAGNDLFAFNVVLTGANSDTIQDFNATGLAGSGDKIALDDAIFAAIGATLDANEFVANAGGVAGDANDFILYDTSTGNLYYDADGNGVGGKILFAQLTLAGVTGTVDASDFSII